MRCKRLISLVSIVAFSLSMFAATPSFSKTQAEKDADQQRLVLALVGGVALVGILFMIKQMNRDKSDFNFNEIQNQTSSPINLPLNAKVEFSFRSQHVDRGSLGFRTQNVNRGSFDNLIPMVKIKIPF